MSLSEKFSEFLNGWLQAKTEQFTGHVLATFLRQDINDEIAAFVESCAPSFLVKASVGNGRWADVPWVSILNPEITSTTQDGIYPVYLFSADGSGFYLSLNQGTTAPTSNLGKKEAGTRAEKIKSILLNSIPELSQWGLPYIDLKAKTTLGKSYEKPNIAAKYYDASQIPSDEVLKADLEALLLMYQKIADLDIEQLLLNYLNHRAEPAMETKGMTRLSKPFLLLAGISGTGKSRFVRKQAEAQGSVQEFFQMVPVRPDWHEPSDLLGYVSRIGGAPKFIVTDALKFMVRAWKATGAQIITLAGGKTGWWSAKALDDIKTYWLCLDEMNLAPVEQYFADYLSVIESRHWLNASELSSTGKEYAYSCLPLLTASTLNAVEEQHRTALATDLGLDIKNSAADLQLWGAFLQHGIPVPFNLVVAGTVNMDETTHGFSRKVIDRALTFDFGRFFPNNFDQLLSPENQPQPVKLQFPRLSNASSDMMGGCVSDPDGQKTIGFLKAVNQVLTDTPFELAYRALNELLLAVICQNPQNDEELQAVWDDFLMCKVLPRIEGDDEKLASFSGGAQSTQTILDELQRVLSVQLLVVWEKERPDLMRVSASATTPLTVPCRSKAKLEWMKNRLERNSFTSFWP
ncbi:DUF3578 domain-containing protein [Rheinheimera sp.]|uniref:DUF3578 domain-containing protein n=1 Tax=Rheinheimera sp. TaxID=1869214 RepID=UPI0027BA7D1A|nr:DUF3578 domain-containing protein [Rheinheimera sp.]